MAGGATPAAGAAPRDLRWSRHRFPESLYGYGAWIAVLAFLAFSVDYLDIPLARIPDMFQRMVSVIAGRYYPPDIEYVLERGYLDYVVETIQMAYLGALFGLAMSIPLGWFGRTT